MSRQLSILEQRIAWTRFARQTDKDVLSAMARWFCWRADGTAREFTVKELAHKAGVPKRSTERALERLEAEWRLEVTTRRHRRPTTYRIVLERLAAEDPDTLTARVADKLTFDRQSGGQDPEWRTRNGPDSEKVADHRSAGSVRTERSETPAADRTVVRQSGGQRPEHPDVPAFLAWAAATYPDHANGAHLVVDRERDGHLVHRLLEHYPLERLQAMTVQLWTLEADHDPRSHASWIAHTDRSLRVLKHKAAFLERVVVGAMQLTLGPLEEVPLTAREIDEAKRIRAHVYGRCPHEPAHVDYVDCVRTIALARRVG